MVEGEGFEPSKAEPSDLQSDPFDRSGTPPIEAIFCYHITKVKQKIILRKDFNLANGAGTRNRTRDLLITSQLLYHLSYASKA